MGKGTARKPLFHEPERPREKETQPMQKRRPQRERPIPAAQSKDSHKHLEIFMRLCREHGISWGTASEEEKSIVEQLLKREYNQYLLEKYGTTER